MLCTHGIDIPLPIPLTCCGRSLTEVRGALESVRALHDVAESRHGAIDRPVANRPNAKVARDDDAEVKPVLRGDVHGRFLLFCGVQGKRRSHLRGMRQAARHRDGVPHMNEDHTRAQEAALTSLGLHVGVVRSPSGLL